MGLACLFGHKWDGCRCVRCGEIRDEGHNYTHFRPSNTGKCVGTCKCGKKQELEHEWVGEKCARCGLRRDFSYEYAMQMMEEKKYFDAFKRFEMLEKGPLGGYVEGSGGSFKDKKKECFDLAYESASDAIVRNDYAYFQYQTLFDYGLDQMEDALVEIELRRKIKNNIQIGRNRHPLMDKLKEQICSAIMESIEKKDYQSAQGWLQSLGYRWKDICKTYIRDSATLNLGLYGIAQQCIDEKEYKEALKWLQALPDDYPNRTEKLEECEKCWQHDSRNPVFCPKSTDGIHRWESVPGSEKKIINGVTNPIYYTERCVYCGREERREYVDYDAIREAYKYNY